MMGIMRLVFQYKMFKLLIGKHHGQFDRQIFSELF